MKCHSCQNELIEIHCAPGFYWCSECQDFVKDQKPIRDKMNELEQHKLAVRILEGNRDWEFEHRHKWRPSEYALSIAWAISSGFPIRQKAKFKVGDRVTYSSSSPFAIHKVTWQDGQPRYNDAPESGIVLAPEPDRVAWTLPPPPEGQQWHRTDWTEEMLPEGWRPFLLNEIVHQRDNQMNSVRGWVLQDVEDGIKAKSDDLHWRTRRPLPAPKQRVPLCAADIPPGSVFRKKSWDPHHWEPASGVSATEVSVGYRKVYAFEGLMEDWLIKRKPDGEWEVCCRDE